MPISAASPPPVMSPHIGHASSSSRTPQNSRPGQSLVDLYNSRHAQESRTTSSSRAPSSSTSLAGLCNQRRDAERGTIQPSSSSLADLYNQRYDAESNKISSKVTSTSLADLYNQRYETEHQNARDSVKQFGADHRRGNYSESRAFAKPAERNRRIRSRNRRIRSTDSSDADIDTAEPRRSIPNDVDELEEGDGDDVEVSSTLQGSRARSESFSLLPNGPEIIYVHKFSAHRRRVLGSSASHLAMESDQEAGTPEPEGPSSSAPLVHLHRSPRKFVVQSASESLEQESAMSTPPIAPSHRKGKLCIAESTQDEESLNSILHSDSIPEGTMLGLVVASTTRSRSYLPRSGIENVGPSDINDIIVVSDSSSDQISRTSPTADRSCNTSTHDSARTSSERSQSPEGGAAAMLQTATSPTQDNIAAGASSHALAHLSSPSPQRTVAGVGGLQPEPAIAPYSDEDSDAPVITNARIGQIQAADSSANATSGNVSDSDGHRSRYPRRARNITDYNVKRAFEALEYAHENQAHIIPTVAVPAVTSTPKSKKTSLPVVIAPAEFFDALNAQSSSTSLKGKEKASSSFAEFLMSKSRSQTAAASTTTTTRSAELSMSLTAGQARAISRLRPASSSISRWEVTVRTDDKSQLYQLKPSTRRWLGISDSDPLDSTVDYMDERPITPPSPGKRHPLPFNFGTLISSHLGGISQSTICDALETCGIGLIGRPKTAVELESTSRRLRLGRSIKLPLPSPLNIFRDKEQEEWVRHEEFVEGMRRMVQENKAKAEGKVLVEVGNDERFQTQWDAMGRKRMSKLTPATGGELRVWFDLKGQMREIESEGVEVQAEEGKSPGCEIVRVRSPRKSPSVGRLGNLAPRDRVGGDTEEMGIGYVFNGAPQRNSERVGQTSVFDLNVPATQSVTPLLPPAKAAPSSKSAQPSTEEIAMTRPVARKTAELQPALKVAKPQLSVALSSGTSASLFKPNSLASKSTASTLKSNLTPSRPKPAKTESPASKPTSGDLLSYFTTQGSPKKPLALPSTSLNSVKGKGKAGALNHEYADCESDFAIVADLINSSSTSESMDRSGSKRDRSASPAFNSSSNTKRALTYGEKKQKKSSLILENSASGSRSSEAKRKQACTKKRTHDDDDDDDDDEVSISGPNPKRLNNVHDLERDWAETDSAMIGRISIEVPEYRDQDQDGYPRRVVRSCKTGRHETSGK
ncbi:uncharacterized protein MEPE_00474 [Melanopsichium pennsylvanicum]|uniref:Uncharacterized protein n=2 Tax=Melanopsichium pennsylvanicum TaxID=63383 RepID=A0AAJ4XG50_9BASI|nr:putative protein [Melanopsichium pennsylvanicum 4]SNX81769.1 uncharacterized protein MEPE_00474 [Melanopsichium pennsylvanicum]